MTNTSVSSSHHFSSPSLATAADRADASHAPQAGKRKSPEASSKASTPTKESEKEERSEEDKTEKKQKKAPAAQAPKAEKAEKEVKAKKAKADESVKKPLSAWLIFVAEQRVILKCRPPPPFPPPLTQLQARPREPHPNSVDYALAVCSAVLTLPAAQGGQPCDQRP